MFPNETQGVFGFQLTGGGNQFFEPFCKPTLVWLLK
jgi:hypothetical protein